MNEINLTKKQIRDRQKCEDSYNVIKDVLELNSSMTVNEQVQKIIYHTDSILTEICEHADLIKIDYLEQVQEIFPIARAQWMEFVKLAVNSATGSISDKHVSKMEESFENSIFITSQRMKFMDTFIKSSGSTKIEFPEKEQDIPLPQLSEFESSEEFELLLQQAVTTRLHLNQVLWPQYFEACEAFQYITNFKFDKNDFKVLVDMWHYRHGGYPNESSVPKLWGIINSFSYVTKLMREFELPQIEQELKRFGITITFDADINQEALRTFSDASSALLDAEMFVIPEEHTSEVYYKAEDLPLDAIFLKHNNKYLVFAGDTREIYDITDTYFNQIDIQNYLIPYTQDSLQPLFLSENSSDILKTYVTNNFSEFI